MRRAMYWLGAVVLMLPAFCFAQTLDDFFDESIVQELRLEIRPSDWALLKLHYLENTYYPAEFRWQFGGKEVVVGDIAIRSRGHGSRSAVKPNLRLDFNRYDPDQKFLAVSSAVLKANNQDTSMIRERTVFKLFQRFGLPASRETHARVYINGEYLGLYLLTEEIRSEYCLRYLGEGSGDLFKFDPIGDDGGYRFEWRPSCARPNQVACSSDQNRWTPAPFNPEENKATYDIAPVMEFIRSINQMPDADFEAGIEKLTEPSLFLSHVALENYVSDFDSILGDVFGMNNFFLYRYRDGKVEFLLWDKDGSYDYARRSIFQNQDQNVLARRLMVIPRRRAQYLEALYKAAVLCGGAGGWLEWLNRQYYKQIKDAVYADPNKSTKGEDGIEKPSTNEIFEATYEKNLKYPGERFAYVLPEVLAAGYQTPSSLVLSEWITDESGAPVAALVPGAVITLSGTGFGDQVLDAPTSGPAKVLGGISVVINGFDAPLLSVAPERIKLQVPAELGFGNGTAPMTVVVAGSTTTRGTREGSPVNASFSNTVSAVVVDPTPVAASKRGADQGN